MATAFARAFGSMPFAGSPHDLGMQIMDRVFGHLCRCRGFTPAFEDACGPLEQRPFPLMDHRRMEPIFSDQLRHRVVSLNGLQRSPRLERCVMVFAFLIFSRLETSRPQIVASVTVQFSGELKARYKSS